MTHRTLAALTVALTSLVSQAASAEPLRGTVAFKGTPPERKPIKRDADPVCARTTQLSDDVIVTDGKLRDVLVRIKNGSFPTTTFPTPTAAALLTQSACAYSPHVIGIMVDQSVAIRNGDPTFHNVRATAGEHLLWNLSQVPQAPDIVKKDLGPAGTVAELHCDVHAWMHAFVVVNDSPYFAVTGDDGSFTIPDVPPGTYTVEAWHPVLGLKTMKVKVTKKKGASATFTYAAAKK